MQDEVQAGETRVWVFGSSKPISAGDPILVGRLKRFFSQWQSHGEAVSGRWRILYDRFLVVLREPEGAQVSGCSIDSMMGDGPDDPQFYRLFTTILDTAEASGAELAAAYVQRWDIELALDELKTHHSGSRAVLRSKSPGLVLQEIWGYLCCHYAIRSLMTGGVTNAAAIDGRTSVPSATSPYLI
jgi:IS4 transposase